MERKAMSKAFKLAAYLCLLTVLLRSVSVDACLLEDDVCDPNNPDCCDGLVCVAVAPGDYRCKPEACQQKGQDCSSLACCAGLECVEVSPGVFQCESECCEDHEDHSCKVHERECCDDGGAKHELVCECDVDEGTCKNYTNKLREVCEPSTAICARRAECVDPNGSGTDHCECRQKGCKDNCDCCVNAVCITECRCNKQEDDPCDPTACIPECCERECVAVAVGDYRCKTV